MIPCHAQIKLTKDSVEVDGAESLESEYRYIKNDWIQTSGYKSEGCSIIL